MPYRAEVFDDVDSEIDAEELAHLNVRALRLSLLIIPRDERVRGDTIGAWDEAYAALQKILRRDSQPSSN